MPATFRKDLFAIAAATFFSVGAAHAEIHDVLIMDGGYFPQVLYIEEGDQIRFTNETTGNHQISGLEFTLVEGSASADATNTQDVVVLPNQDVVIEISSNSALVFSGAWPANVGNVIEGELSYEEPPLEENSALLDAEYEN